MRPTSSPICFTQFANSRVNIMYKHAHDACRIISDQMSGHLTLTIALGLIHCVLLCTWVLQMALVPGKLFFHPCLLCLCLYSASKFVPFFPFSLLSFWEEFKAVYTFCLFSLACCFLNVLRSIGVGVGQVLSLVTLAPSPWTLRRARLGVLGMVPPPFSIEEMHLIYHQGFLCF